MHQVVSTAANSAQRRSTRAQQCLGWHALCKRWFGSIMASSTSHASLCCPGGRNVQQSHDKHCSLCTGPDRTACATGQSDVESSCENWSAFRTCRKHCTNEFQKQVSPTFGKGSGEECIRPTCCTDRCSVASSCVPVGAAEREGEAALAPPPPPGGEWSAGWLRGSAS